MTLDPRNSNLVAVYGTLRRDYGNNYLIQSGGGEHVADATATGWAMYSWGGFPAICETGLDADVIVCEVYAVDDETLARLDALEGYSAREGDRGFYDRRTVTVETTDGASIEALIYCMPVERAASRGQRVAGGDWKAFHPPYDRAVWKNYRRQA